MTASDPEPPSTVAESNLKKFTIDTVINAPRDLFVELFMNPDCIRHRAENFDRRELIAGHENKAGARYRMVHKALNKEYSYEETIDSMHLPNELVTRFEANGGNGKARNVFESYGPEKTRWLLNVEHQSKGPVRFVEFLLPNLMKATAIREMEKFKSFVEQTYKSA